MGLQPGHEGGKRAGWRGGEGSPLLRPARLCPSSAPPDAPAAPPAASTLLPPSHHLPEPLCWARVPPPGDQAPPRAGDWSSCSWWAGPAQRRGICRGGACALSHLLSSWPVRARAGPAVHRSVRLSVSPTVACPWCVPTEAAEGGDPPRASRATAAAAGPRDPEPRGRERAWRAPQSQSARPVPPRSRPGRRARRALGLRAPQRGVSLRRARRGRPSCVSAFAAADRHHGPRESQGGGQLEEVYLELGEEGVPGPNRRQLV